MARKELGAVRGSYRRKQPPGIVLIVMIATLSIGTLLICAQAARIVYATGVTGDIRSRLQADYRPWTPQAFAPVSTGITLGTPGPLRASPSILDMTATPTCAPSPGTCEPNPSSSPGAGLGGTSLPTIGSSTQPFHGSSDPGTDASGSP